MNLVEDICTIAEEEPETTLNPDDGQSGITDEDRERRLGDGGAVRPED